MPLPVSAYPKLRSFKTALRFNARLGQWQHCALLHRGIGQLRQRSYRRAGTMVGFGRSRRGAQVASRSRTRGCGIVVPNVRLRISESDILGLIPLRNRLETRRPGVRHFSCFLRSGSPNCWHCETPLYAAGGRIFILSTLISGTRGVKGEAHCAISLPPTPSTPLRAGSCAKNAQEWGTPSWVMQTKTEGWSMAAPRARTAEAVRLRLTSLQGAGSSIDEPAEAADSPSPRAECG